MSDSDYKMGQQGLRFESGMNKQDFDRGKADKADQEAAAAGAKTEVPGAGIGLILMAPILAVMYPIAAAVEAVAVGGYWLLTGSLSMQAQGGRFVIAIIVGLSALYFALKAEHKVSEFKPYRIVRHVVRLIAAGVITFGFMINVGHSVDFETALNHAPPSSLFAALVAIGLMAWLGPRFDRVFFPVRDAYAIKMEKKYAGMSVVEIDETKHADFRARLKFAAVWLAGTIALMFAIPHGPVALMAIGWFGVCWFGRKVLGSRKASAG
jgi:hypothetical protein